MSFITSNWDWLTAIVGTFVGDRWVGPILWRKAQVAWAAFRAAK